MPCSAVHMNDCPSWVVVGGRGVSGVALPGRETQLALSAECLQDKDVAKCGQE